MKWNSWTGQGILAEALKAVGLLKQSTPESTCFLNFGESNQAPFFSSAVEAIAFARAKRAEGFEKFVIRVFTNEDKQVYSLPQGETVSGLANEGIVWDVAFEGMVNDDLGLQESGRYARGQYDDQVLTNETFIGSRIPNFYPTADEVGAIVLITSDSRSRRLIEKADVTDDGFNGWKAIFESKGLKFSFITVPENELVASTMTKSEMLQLQSEGYEARLHIVAGHNGENNNLTEEQADAYLSNRLGILKDEGYNIKHGTWFGTVSTPSFRSIIPKHLKSVGGRRLYYGRGDTDRFMRPDNQYGFVRLDMDNIDLNEWKRLVDRAIELKRPICMFWHAHFDTWYFDKRDDDGELDVNGTYGWEKMIALIDYIQAKPNYGTPGEIDMVSTHEDFINLTGNAIELGGFSREIDDQPNVITIPHAGFRVSKRGELFFEKASFLDFTKVSTVKIGQRIIDEGTATQSTLVGSEAGANSGNTNNKTMFGFRAGRNSSTNGGSAFFGRLAGETSIGINCSFFGDDSGSGNTGAQSTGLGSFSAKNNTGSLATFVGYESGLGNSGSGCTGVGRNSLFGNTANDVSSYGAFSGQGNTGTRSVFGGTSSGRDNVGFDVISFGWTSGRDNTGNRCVFLGREAGRDNTIDNRFEVVQRALTTNSLIDADFQHGGIALGSPSTANKLADSRIGANRFTFYLDESTDKLHVRVKYADGTTIKVGEVALV